MARFSDIRQTLLKGVDTPDPHDVATPRMISPYFMGQAIARIRGVFPDIFVPVKTRKIRKPRQRVRGVALTEKPWSVDG